MQTWARPGPVLGRLPEHPEHPAQARHQGSEGGCAASGSGCGSHCGARPSPRSAHCTCRVIAGGASVLGRPSGPGPVPAGEAVPPLSLSASQSGSSPYTRPPLQPSVLFRGGPHQAGSLQCGDSPGLGSLGLLPPGWLLAREGHPLSGVSTAHLSRGAGDAECSEEDPQLRAAQPPEDTLCACLVCSQGCSVLGFIFKPRQAHGCAPQWGVPPLVFKPLSQCPERPTPSPSPGGWCCWTGDRSGAKQGKPLPAPVQQVQGLQRDPRPALLLPLLTSGGRGDGHCGARRHCPLGGALGRHRQVTHAVGRAGRVVGAQ